MHMHSLSCTLALTLAHTFSFMLAYTSLFPYVIVVLVAKLCLNVTPWTVAHQSPLSMGFSRQEYWSGLPFPSPGDLPNPGIKPMSPT